MAPVGGVGSEAKSAALDAVTVGLTVMPGARAGAGKMFEQGAKKVVAAEVGAANAARGAASPKNNANLSRLNKQLASEAQLGQKGEIIAGGPGKPELRKAAQLAQENGGNATDYVKKRSTSYTPMSPTGQPQTPFEIHFEENMMTGQRYNVKTIVNPNQKP